MSDDLQEELLKIASLTLNDAELFVAFNYIKLSSLDDAFHGTNPGEKQRLWRNYQGVILAKTHPYSSDKERLEAIKRAHELKVDSCNKVTVEGLTKTNPGFSEASYKMAISEAQLAAIF